jgi:hypothetical protein
VNAADPALGFQPALIALAAIGRIPPYVRGGVVVGDDIAQHAPVVAPSVVLPLRMKPKARQMAMLLL